MYSPRFCVNRYLNFQPLILQTNFWYFVKSKRTPPKFTLYEWFQELDQPPHESIGSQNCQELTLHTYLNWDLGTQINIAMYISAMKDIKCMFNGNPMREILSFDESEPLFSCCGDFWIRNLRHIAFNVNFSGQWHDFGYPILDPSYTATSYRI